MGDQMSDALGSVPASEDVELEQLFSYGAKRQHDAIERRAHQTFVERGKIHGLDLQDWLAAEREILGAR